MKINLIFRKVHIDNWFNEKKTFDYEESKLKEEKNYQEEKNIKIGLMQSYNQALNEFEKLLRNEYNLQHKLKISKVYVEDYTELLKTVIEKRNCMENAIINFYDSLQIEYKEDSKFLQNFTNPREHINNFRTYLTNEYTFQIKIKKLKKKVKKLETINENQRNCKDYFNSFCL